jgi:ribosomal protein L16 Arg81 hydroxylase
MANKELGLSLVWRRWIARALAEGSSSTEILAALRTEGVPVRLAIREISTISDAISEVLVTGHRLELVRRLLDRHSARGLDRRKTIDAETFYAQYFAPMRPLLLTAAFDATAARRWTFAKLRKRFGAAELRVSADRDRDPSHYVNPEVTYQMMRFDALVDHALAGKPSNDVYLVSRNRALEGPLAPLVADLAPLPAFLDPTPDARGTSIWLGPAGTLTPLHHDTSHIVFVQLVGRKRFTLAPAWHREVLTGTIHDTFYAEQQKPDGAIVVELGPGDALYLPIGTWHHVVALEPSISLSLTAFRWPSTFDWYRPGAITAPDAAPSRRPASARRRSKPSARPTRTRRRRA